MTKEKECCLNCWYRMYDTVPSKTGLPKSMILLCTYPKLKYTTWASNAIQVPEPDTHVCACHEWPLCVSGVFIPPQLGDFGLHKKREK